MTNAKIIGIVETAEIAPRRRIDFERRVELAKEYLTGTDFPQTNEKLDELNLSISDLEVQDDLAHIELEDMAEVCGERIWITVAR